MSSVGPEGRSYAAIRPHDLERLAEIAARDRADFFCRHPDWARLYADRVLCTALCQGAALHYVTGEVGINDFDVYTFYAAHPARPWYAQRKKSYDFGDPRFGRSVDRPEYVGRRVDVMARDLPAAPGADPLVVLPQYLRAGRTVTARLLALKGVVLLEPQALRGTIVWPAYNR